MRTVNEEVCTTSSILQLSNSNRRSWGAQKLNELSTTGHASYPISGDALALSSHTERDFS